MLKVWSYPIINIPVTSIINISCVNVQRRKITCSGSVASTAFSRIVIRSIVALELGAFFSSILTKNNAFVGST